MENDGQNGMGIVEDNIFDYHKLPDIKSGQSFNGHMTSEEFRNRKKEAEFHYRNFLYALGYNVDEDPALQKTPYRVTKMMMNEISKGTYESIPEITVFPNTNKYNGLVFEGNIELKSICAHHCMPFMGVCHIAYFPDSNIIGISKLNRLVDYCARRLQTQEYLTQLIHETLNSILIGNHGIAVYCDAQHTCVSHRGVNQDSNTQTCMVSGFFLENAASKQEFLQMISNLKK